MPTRNNSDMKNLNGINAYMHQILEETPNGVLVVDLDHQVIFSNPAASLFLGIPHEDLFGSSLESHLVPEHSSLFHLIEDACRSSADGRKSRCRKEIETGQDDIAKRVLDVVFVYPPSSPD